MAGTCEEIGVGDEMMYSQEMRDSIQANDPFSSGDKDNEETLDRLNSSDPASYHNQPHEHSRGTKQMNTENLDMKKKEGRPQLFFVVQQKALTSGLIKGEKVPFLWKPSPVLATLMGPFQDVESAAQQAVGSSRHVIQNGSKEERLASIEFIVVGPFESKRECQETLLPHCYDIGLTEKDKSAMRSGKLSGKEFERLKAKYTKPNMRILTKVSTRYYNTETYEPQVSHQSMGGLAPNDFKSRFPGGEIPYKAIQEAMTGKAADALLKDMQSRGELPSSVTGDEVRAALPDIMQALQNAESMDES